MIAVLLCTGLHAFGQLVGSGRDFKEFQKRPLLVILPETGGAKSKAEVDRVNQVFKSQVRHFWTFNKDITFMGASELKALTKKKSQEIATHAVLEFAVWEVTKTKTSGNGTTYSGSWNSSTLSVSLLENIVKNRYTYLHNFDTVYPSQADLVSALLQIQDFMTKTIQYNQAMTYPDESKRNAGQLGQVTLLIDKEQLKGNLTEQEIKQNYSLPYQIVTTKEVEEAILQRKPGFAYVRMLPAGVRMPGLKAQVVLDAATGQVLAHSFPPTFRVGNSSGDKIGERNLKDYVQFVKK